MEKDLEQRTKRFAPAVLEFASSLPGNRAGMFWSDSCSVRRHPSEQITEKRIAAYPGPISLTRLELSKKKPRKLNTG